MRRATNDRPGAHELALRTSWRSTDRTARRAATPAASAVRKSVSGRPRCSGCARCAASMASAALRRAPATSRRRQTMSPTLTSAPSATSAIDRVADLLAAEMRLQQQLRPAQRRRRERRTRRRAAPTSSIDSATRSSHCCRAALRNALRVASGSRTTAPASVCCSDQSRTREVVAGKHERRRLEPQLRDRARRRPPAPCRPPSATCAATLPLPWCDAHADAVLERPARPRRNLEQHVEDLARAAELRQRDDIAAMHAFDRVDVGQVERGPRAGPARFDVAAVRLDPADARRLARRLDDDRLAAPQRAAEQRSGHHGADARQREHAIDRQPRLADVARRQASRPARAPSVAFRSSSPRPVTTDVGTIGASANGLPLQPLADGRDGRGFVRAPGRPWSAPPPRGARRSR